MMCIEDFYGGGMEEEVQQVASRMRVEPTHPTVAAPRTMGLALVNIRH